MAGSPPLSDEEYQALLSELDALIDAFLESSQCAELPDHQRREAGFVVECFGEFLFAYEGTSFADTTTEAVERVCTRTYPAKVAVEPAHFETVAPVIAAFFRFLDDRGEVAHGERLANHVMALDEDIVAAGADPDAWGMGKSMTMEEGIDDVQYLDDVAPEQPAAVELTDHERDLIREAAASVSPETERVLEALDDVPESADVIDELTAQGITEDEVADAYDELLDAMLDAGQELFSPAGDDADPRVLDEADASRFHELYTRVLGYVNDRTAIAPRIADVREITVAGPGDAHAIRDRLFWGSDTTELIEAYVDENPHDLSEPDLEAIAAWTDVETGSFAVVERRPDVFVFLDIDESRAYGVTAPSRAYADDLLEVDLPMALANVVLLPFEDTIVADEWLESDSARSLSWELLGKDVEAAYAEVISTVGLDTTLPPTDGDGVPEAERLRYYLKNQENRERYAEEIDRLKDQSAELEQIYHTEAGKAAARSLGHEFRDLGLDAAYVGIYDGRVVASGRTEEELRDILASIMPEGKEDHPYIYHYDP